MPTGKYPRGTKSERFWRNVIKSQEENLCWNWVGCRDSKGYGRFRFNYDNIIAHRYSYELHVGIIPSGLVIDHLCRNTSCINPKHLEPVTIYENCRRGIEALGGRKIVFANSSFGKPKLLIGSLCGNGLHLIKSNKDATYSGRGHCRECGIEAKRIRQAKWRVKWRARLRAVGKPLVYVKKIT